MVKNLLFVFATIFSFGAAAQNIFIDNAQTPANLVQNVLVGQGLSVSNITFAGNPAQIGYFEANGSNIGLDSGVVMTSGNVNNLVPPLNPSTSWGGPGDADLLATAQSVTSNPQAGNITSTHDAAILEFDFVPDGDVVSFRFVFGSEEYLTYVNSVFNDVFGFYLTGPNPAGGNYNVDNLALVPGTSEAITISTIHPGLNAQYYIDIEQGHSFNGFTVPIDITFDAICGETYHFKFAVADCQDGILDTGVFLEGGSFNALPVDLTFETGAGDTLAFEGCNEIIDVFVTRPSCQSIDTLVVDLDFTGSATPGVDYTNISTQVVFLPGVDTMSFQMIPVADAFAEGIEEIIITATTTNIYGDTVQVSGTIYIQDVPPLQVAAMDTSIYCIYDTIVTVYGSYQDGYFPVTYGWDTGDSTLTFDVDGTVNGTYEYIMTATDGCGFMVSDTATIIINETLSIDSVSSLPSGACNPTGDVFAYPSGYTGMPDVIWVGPGDSSLMSIEASVWNDIPSGWYYFTITDDVCVKFDSVFVDLLPPPTAEIDPVFETGCAGMVVTFSNSSQNATSYEWNFGNGDPVINTTSTANQTAVFNSSSVVSLTAFDDAGCSDVAFANIEIVQCGCMDPEGINYDPTAVIDDGSCIYPDPIIIEPNVFTPGTDNVNDVFYFETQYVDEFHMVITNRWGNVMYDGFGFPTQGSTPAWDGMVNAKLADEGVYFYRYEATGLTGQVVEGHGFFHLSR